MVNEQSPLVAFRVCVPEVPIIRSGHYDADQQVWVGNEIASRNVVTSVATSVASEETQPFAIPDGPVADVDMD